MSTSTTITAIDGGTFDAYTAIPAAPNGAGIIVIQEIFGVNAEVRMKCDLWAAKGYMAMAPDLFWRQEPGVDITPKNQAHWDHAMALLQGFNVDSGVDDLKATMETLRTKCHGKMGTVGYCLGGRLAYLMGTRSQADANVSYYGVTLEAYLNESNALKTPLMLHIAEEDKYVSRETQEHIKTALATNTHVTIHSYPGVDHAFSRLDGDHYDEAAAMLANNRTEDFFAQHLLGRAQAAA